MGLDIKGNVLSVLFRNWPTPRGDREGYSVLLPSPMDMPFMLRYTLEGLRHLDTTHCNQILVIPDGVGSDGDALLRQVTEWATDPRLEIAEVRARDRFLIRQMKPVGGSGTHWMQVVLGIGRCVSRYVFLHDADAFHLDADGIEQQYRACRDGGLSTLGVTARWDPFFEAIGYRIPVTWELLFSTEWVRSRPPFALKGRLVETLHGPNVFDTMLYPQYLDYPTGKIGVMASPPRFVHFSAAIQTYRLYHDRAGRGVVDELFRLLLLAVLETLIPANNGDRLLPTVNELARGLKDPNAPVRYDSEVAIRGYGEFREMLDGLCESPVFRGQRAEHIRRLVAPYDDHFGHLAIARGGSLGEPIRKFRAHGLG